MARRKSDEPRVGTAAVIELQFHGREGKTLVARHERSAKTRPRFPFSMLSHTELPFAAGLRHHERQKLQWGLR